MSWGTGAAPGTPAAGPRRPAPRPAGTTPWAELHCHSSYSFLDGAATPGELVAEAARLGLDVLALTDHDGMYGVPQFAQAAARLADRGGPKLGTVFGAELSLGLPGNQNGVPDPAGRHLLVLARDAEGYRRLCAVISAAQLAGGEKGRPVYDVAALADAHGGHWAVLTGCRKGAVPAALARGRPAGGLAGTGRADCDVRARERDGRADLPARPGRRRAQRHAGRGWPRWPTSAWWPPATCTTPRPRRPGFARRWPRSGPAAAWTTWTAGCPRRVPPTCVPARRWPPCCAGIPGVLERTVELGRACAFDFTVIAPRLPDFPVPDGHTEASWLRELTARKAPPRYGAPGAERVPGSHAQIARELDVIERLEFAGYFLIVHDIVAFCEDNDILCQGRGSAANSAVCFALGITSVDPVRTTCCSSGSCPRAGTARRTSTWTSSTAAARRSSSTSTGPTAGPGPPRSPT